MNMYAPYGGEACDLPGRSSSSRALATVLRLDSREALLDVHTASRPAGKPGNTWRLIATPS